MAYCKVQNMSSAQLNELNQLCCDLCLKKNNSFSLPQFVIRHHQASVRLPNIRSSRNLTSEFKFGHVYTSIMTYVMLITLCAKRL